MGKLHTLKRAIKKNPQQWGNSYSVFSAYFNKKEKIWMPFSSYRHFNGSYVNFVKYVLKNMRE